MGIGILSSQTTKNSGPQSIEGKLVKMQEDRKGLPYIFKEDLCVWETFAVSSPHFIVIAIVLLTSYMIGLLGIYAWAIILGALLLILMCVLRAYELATATIIILHIYVDWYSGLLLPSLIVTLLLLVVFFLFRDAQHPWENPHMLWLWAAFLLLAIYPAVQGTLRAYDAVFYYPNIVAGALLTFWLGTVVAKDVKSTRKVFQMLAFIQRLAEELS